MSSPSLRATRVAFAHASSRPLFSDLDLHLVPGFAGLVGANGSGKTTLLRLLAGEIAPDAGAIRLTPPGGTIALCEQRVDAPPRGGSRLAGAQDGGARRLRDALALAPVDLARWPTLSPGERKRWQIGAALAAEPELLLLDEPTNHLDAAGRAALIDALAGFRGIGVIVSHDRALLDALTTTTIRIERGRAEVRPGAYGEARRQWELERLAAREARAAAEGAVRAAARRLDDARRTRASAEQGRSTRARTSDQRDHDARSMGAKVVAGWAEARAGRTVAVRRTELERAERALAERPVARETGGNVWLRWEPAPRARLLALDGARVDAGGAPLLGDVRVSLGRADRVWVRGANGAGKSTLIAALLRAASLPEGRLVTLAQETGPDDDARDLAAVRRLAPDVRGRVLAHAAALGVDPDALLATGRPSPGEARQLRIALGLGTHAWGLVLDEPTNHLDLPAIERLERALADYPGALLLATHDEALARRCARVAWTVAGGRVEVGAL